MAPTSRVNITAARPAARRSSCAFRPAGTLTVYDEDEGCGNMEDAVVWRPDGNGNMGRHNLPWDVEHDAACYKIEVNSQ